MAHERRADTLVDVLLCRVRTKDGVERVRLHSSALYVYVCVSLRVSVVWGVGRVLWQTEGAMTLVALYCIGGSVGRSEPRSGRTRRHTLSALLADAASTERVRRCDLRIVATDALGVLDVGAAMVCPKPESAAVLWWILDW